MTGIRARSSYKMRTQPEREAINAPIQGSAADMMKLAMLNLHRRIRAEKLPAKMLLQIHDELVFEVEPAAVKLAESLVTLGLSTSKRGDYAMPIAKPYAGIAAPFAPR